MDLAIVCYLLHFKNVCDDNDDDGKEEDKVGCLFPAKSDKR